MRKGIGKGFKVKNGLGKRAVSKENIHHRVTENKQNITTGKHGGKL
jgi:hypothetical protein